MGSRESATSTEIGISLPEIPARRSIFSLTYFRFFAAETVAESTNPRTRGAFSNHPNIRLKDRTAWLRWQSDANRSPPKIPANREKNREFRRFVGHEGENRTKLMLKINACSRIPYSA